MDDTNIATVVVIGFCCLLLGFVVGVAVALRYAA